MFSKLLKSVMGWNAPELGYPYRITRLSRDQFAIELGGKNVKMAAEVGERQAGRYEITIFPSTAKCWGDGTQISGLDRELVLQTLEQFLAANNYLPKRA